MLSQNDKNVKKWIFEHLRNSLSLKIYFCKAYNLNSYHKLRPLRFGTNEEFSLGVHGNSFFTK